MTKYLDFDSSMTLGEAIQKMRMSAAENDFTNQVSADTIQALEQHDAIHILFDCGTSSQDEIAVHVWMVFATTAKISEMHRAVASQEHRTALAGIGHLKLIGTWCVSFPLLVRIIFKSLRMTKKLAVEELHQLKQQSIFEIRQEHGIVL